MGHDAAGRAATIVTTPPRDHFWIGGKWLTRLHGTYQADLAPPRRRAG